ncbi:ABC transporter permease [Streptomyces sp. NBC_01283]|uniref:ABC transporter permease n=1 Tax=Streptomyces sp. NBC_01283 TaxID=2903812 RepID=UPI00352F6DCD|nr:ABC transporter permease [Streptomyces sp. NBC_01283]
MSTATAVPAPYRLTSRGILRSEWHKLWTLRSTWIMLGVASVCTVILGMILGATYTSSPGEEIDPVTYALLGTQIGQVSIAVLAILITAGEYSTGMVRATMTAVPRRLPVLWSKAAVFTTVALGTLLVTNYLAFPLAQMFLGGTDLEASLGDPGIARALAGSAAGTTLIGVIVLGLGSALRSIPGAIGAYVGGLILLPQLATMIPNDTVQDLLDYFPLPAAESLAALHTTSGELSPGAGLVALCAWAVASLAAAAYLLKRRDV